MFQRAAAVPVTGQTGTASGIKSDLVRDYFKANPESRSLSGRILAAIISEAAGMTISYRLINDIKKEQTTE